MSIQDIRQNAQDISNFYLANVYQILADPNQTKLSLPSSPTPFSPPNYAVWVNALWFLSLVISLTCALLATLLQQWARRYLKLTHSRYAPHKRARIRAFLSEGVEKLLLPWTVEALPTLLHISLFLFFAGLVVFLWNVNLTIFKLVLSWVGVCTALYGCITTMPIIRHDSPYHTPLSLPAWHIVTGIQFFTFWALRRLAHQNYCSGLAYNRFDHPAWIYGRWLVQGMQKTVEETALNSPLEIDARAFLWTFDCLDEDHELERFFSGIPGFRSSKVVKDPFLTLAEEAKQRLFTALTGLLYRTFSSDLLPEAVKKRRAIICTKAVDPVHTSSAFSVLKTILFKYQFSDPLVTEIAQVVRGWDIDNDNAISDANANFMKIVARAQPLEDSWFILASKSLGVPEVVLRDYAAHGDSLSLAILIHVTRQQFSHFRELAWPVYEFSTVLEDASEFNVQDTLPELQHEFCAFWNQIVRKVQNDNDRRMASYILGRIRNVYIVLHQDTNSSPTGFSVFTGDWDPGLSQPSSYPLCNVPGHRPESTNNIHDDSASTAFAPGVPHDHDNTATASSFLASVLDTPYLSAHAPRRVDEGFTDVMPPDNLLPVPVSPQPIDQTTTETCRITTASNPVTTRATRRVIDTSARPTHLSTPEPSVSPPRPKSRASTSPPEAVSIEQSAGFCAPSTDASSSLPTPVLDNILPIDPPLTLDSPVTRSDLIAEYHLSVPGSPGPSRRWLSSAPELCTATEGESSATAALRTEVDAPYPSSAIHEDIMTNPDLPPQSPSPMTDIAIMGRSHTALLMPNMREIVPRGLCAASMISCNTAAPK